MRLLRGSSIMLGIFSNTGARQLCSCQLNQKGSKLFNPKSLAVGEAGNPSVLIVASRRNFSRCRVFQQDNGSSSNSSSPPGGGGAPPPGYNPFEGRKAGKRGTEFYDSLRIHVKAGSGGRGLPENGGIGGKGGDVIAVGHKDITLKKLSELQRTKRFTAAPGSDSKFFCLNGTPGKNTLIPVPVGVSVITEFGHKLGEINKHGQKVVIAQGGVGGTPSNNFFAEKGQTYNVHLDLKLIADVGFVGFPNAGKSTLLKALSRASPKIASYPFTTIRPNIGVIEYQDYRKISLADLPGLIEGAHINIGMGHKFLKHVERTKMLLFVVDIHGFQLSPQYTFRSALETIVLLNKELELYKEELTEKPAILVLNKMDLPGSFDVIYKIRDTLSDEETYEKYLRTMPEEYWPENVMLFDEIIPISAAKDPLSVMQLKNKIRRLIDANHYLQNDESSALITRADQEEGQLTK